MTLPLVSKRKHGSTVNECSAWRDRALRAEEANVTLAASNGALTGRVEGLERQLSATNRVAEGLRSALDAGAATSESSAARDVDARVQAVEKKLEAAKDQIARQQSALDGYERDRQELLVDLRRLAEERDTAVRTVERLSREGAWNPQGVAS